MNEPLKLYCHESPRSCLSSRHRAKIVDTARGIIPMPFDGSLGSASRSIPVMVKVLPLLVWPYARIVQLKPSMKREIRGCAVDVNMACWVVAGEWTWSKLNTCFLADGAAGAGAPPLAVDETGSTATVFDETALTTDRWKRAGMELVS